MDKLFGGVGLRRGRTHPTELSMGDSLDSGVSCLTINKTGDYYYLQK